jgi:hypothetical protein
MSRQFNPVISSTSDGSDITLCKILEATAAGGGLTSGFSIPKYDEVVFQNNGNGDPTYIGFKVQGDTVYGLDLQYDGNGFLTRIVID